jgi:hypothetical protein
LQAIRQMFEVEEKPKKIGFVVKEGQAVYKIGSAE